MENDSFKYSDRLYIYIYIYIYIFGGGGGGAAACFRSYEKFQLSVSLTFLTKYSNLHNRFNEYEEYSTDEFSKRVLFCLFIHETDSYICKSCQVFFVMT